MWLGGPVRKIGLSYWPVRLGIDYRAPQMVYKYELSLYVCRRSSFGGGGGWGGDKSNDDEKAWSSINHSIFSRQDEAGIFNSILA